LRLRRHPLHRTVRRNISPRAPPQKLSHSPISPRIPRTHNNLPPPPARSPLPHQLLLNRKFKMSSKHHIEANRRNSQLSGSPLGHPRTPDGQAVPSGRSHLCILKSGINVKTQVIPGEDRAELEAMIAGYHQYWTPTNYIERFLVDSLSAPSGSFSASPGSKPNSGIIRSRMPAPPPSTNWMRTLRLATSTAAAPSASPVCSAGSIPPSVLTIARSPSYSASTPKLITIPRPLRNPPRPRTRKPSLRRPPPNWVRSLNLPCRAVRM